MKFKYIIFLFLSIFGIISCTKDFEDINQNPNESEVPVTSALLTGAQNQLTTDMWDAWYNGRFGLLYSQYWAQNAYSDESRWVVRAGVNNNYWNYFYTGRAGNNGGGGIHALQKIIDLNNDGKGQNDQLGSKDNQIAVARILKAYFFQYLTDIYGDIPYSEAFKGATNPSPKYDSQESIYTDLVKELKEASAQIKENELGVVGDNIYYGDMSKWKKFANSLLLRVGTRMSDAAPSVATDAINFAIANGLFADNSDNAYFHFSSSVPNNNPLNEDRKTRADFAVSKTLLDTMSALNDPRIPAYAAPAVKSGVFIGKLYGMTPAAAAAEDPGFISQPSATVLDATAPGILMNYAEVQFALAEAVERGIIAGSAADYYNAGIKASMTEWGVSEADADIYVNQSGVSYSTVSGDWKHKIGFQKWLSLYMQGIQGWSEYRRLDFGVLIFPQPSTVAYIPSRMRYPTNEQTVNRDNYKAAVASQGADNLKTKLWWDKF